MNDTKFTPRTAVEREQVVALVAAALDLGYADASSAKQPEWLGTLKKAERMVAPVPRVLREVVLSNGHTYRVHDGVLERQDVADKKIWYINTLSPPLSRAEIKTLNDLFENPDEPAPAAPAFTRQQCVDALVGMGGQYVHDAWKVMSNDGGEHYPKTCDVIILPREVTP